MKENDRYSTEIVLQNYNSQLHILDSRPEGGGYRRDDYRGRDRDEDDYSSGRSSQSRSPHDEDDFDDEDSIPF